MFNETFGISISSWTWDRKYVNKSSFFVSEKDVVEITVECKIRYMLMRTCYLRVGAKSKV